MPAKRYNSYWKLRERHGREKEYTPAKLWKAACEYFEWSESNPLVEDRVLNSGKRRKVNHPRPFTVKAMCSYLNISERTWNAYCKGDEDFLRVTEHISNIIYVQKFEGAAVSFFNANLISRDLGLADKMRFDVEELSDEQLDRIIKKNYPNQKIL